MSLRLSYYRIGILISVLLLHAVVVYSQPADTSLFGSNEVLNISIKGDLKELLRDRSGKSTKSYSLTLSYITLSSVEVSIPVNVKTRGHFRLMRENCSYPPLLLQFRKGGQQLSTLFKDQRKLKLVMPCKGDEYVIREWLVYKLYNLVTPFSFRARLVSVKLEDTRSKKPSDAFYGILIEEEKQMAKRNAMKAIDAKLIPQHLQVDGFLKMSVFQYLIGNTDWSVEFLQNIKLLSKSIQERPIAVPYDFDHAGIVEAPYAHPAEELQMSSTRERRYRGYCVTNLSVFEPVISFYNGLKEDIYKIYTSCPLLSEKQKQNTVAFLDVFYKTINNTKAWQRDFYYPCDKNGTGNVIIKGLKEN